MIKTLLYIESVPIALISFGTGQLVIPNSHPLPLIAHAVPPDFDYQSSKKRHRQKILGSSDDDAYAASAMMKSRSAATSAGGHRRLQNDPVPAYFLRLNRTDGSILTSGTFLTGLTPCLEAHTYDRSDNIIYAQMCPEDASAVYMLGIDATTGQVVSNRTLNFSNLFQAVAWDSVSEKSYGIVSTTFQGTFLAQADLGKGGYKQIGQPFPAELAQYNSITTVAGAINTYFFTAFTYPQPQQPQLWLIGVDLTTGSINYQLAVDNPFIDIVWIKGSN